MNLKYTRQARADLRNPMRLNPKIVKLCAVLKTHPEIGGQLSNNELDGQQIFIMSLQENIVFFINMIMTQ